MDDLSIKDVAGTPHYIALDVWGVISGTTTVNFGVRFSDPLTDEQVKELNTRLKEHEDVVCASRSLKDDHVLTVSCTRADSGVVTWMQKGFEPSLQYTAFEYVTVRGNMATTKTTFLGRQPDQNTIHEITEIMAATSCVTSVVFTQIDTDPVRYQINVEIEGVPDDHRAHNKFFSELTGSQSYYGATLAIEYA